MGLVEIFANYACQLFCFLFSFSSFIFSIEMYGTAFVNSVKVG